MPNAEGRLEPVWTDVQGLRIHTRRSLLPAPPALPVVLVHGLGVSSRYMIPTAEHLAPDVDVYAPDLPGFGRSDRPAHVFDVPQMAAFLEAWMRTMGLTRALWLGNSFGCQVLVELAVRHPARVAGLVLVGLTPDVAHRQLARHVVRLAADAFLDPAPLVFIAARDYLSAGVRRCWRTFRYLMADPVEQKLPHVAPPVLVVRGARDPIVSAEWTERAVALLPDARLAEVPGAAHAVNFSHPADLTRLVHWFQAAALAPDRPETRVAG